MEKNIILILAALLLLTACTATRLGIQEDARTMGEKTQRIGHIMAGTE